MVFRYRQAWLLKQALVVIGTAMYLASAASVPLATINSQFDKGERRGHSGKPGASISLSPAAVSSTDHHGEPEQGSERCPWTYQLEGDEARYPKVLVVARCLTVSDHCETVYTQITVTRRNSTTRTLHSVTERFAVACRPKPRPTTPDDPFNPDYTFNHDDYS